MDNTDINDMPKCMAERALLVRKLMINNPELIQFDNQMLAWSYSKDDKLWYSLAGNYSRKSPAEKDIAEQEYLDKMSKLKFESDKKYEAIKESISYWSEIRLKILERDNYTCQMCGKHKTTKFHIHHILKKKQGGTDHFDNLITVCPKCHSFADRKGYNPDWEKVK